MVWPEVIYTYIYIYSTCLAQWAEHVTLDPGVVNSSPMLSVGIT